MLRTMGFDPVPKDSSGDTTPVPNDADVFKFTFKVNGKPISPAWITVDSDQDLKVYYDDSVFNNVSEDEDEHQHAKSFYDFLKQLKMWAKRRQLGFDLENQDHLAGDMALRQHMKTQEQLNEGYYPINKTSSYNDNIPTIKIVLQHTRQIQEGEQRFRNISKIFLENMDGERILAPTNRPGIAQIYARHLAEGGSVNDERWNHIKSICEEYTKMAGFVRATRNKQFNESAHKLVESGIDHYNSLRETLNRMRSHRGYNNYFENYTPPLMEDDTELSSINELFVQETLDPRIESVMPILSRLNKGKDITEVSELSEWADNLIGEATDLKSIPEDNTDYDEDLDGNPYEMGYRAAALYSKGKNSNPFEYGDPRHDEWENGWREGVAEEGLYENIDMSPEQAKQFINKPAVFRKQEKFLKSKDKDWMVTHDILSKSQEPTDMAKRAQEVGLTEDEESIRNGIHRDLLNWYKDKLTIAIQNDGFDVVMDTISQVAYDHKNTEELGTSDRHNLCKLVLSQLDIEEPEEGGLNVGQDLTEKLGKEQLRVGQVSGTEKAKTIKGHIGKPNQPHPFRGRLVGASESKNSKKIDEREGSTYEDSFFEGAEEEGLNEINETQEGKKYVCVHAKKGKCEVTANSSYEAAKKAAEKWKLKTTAGIDAYPADKPVDPAQLGESQTELEKILRLIKY